MNPKYSRTWTALLVPLVLLFAGCLGSSDPASPAPDTTPPSVPVGLSVLAWDTYLQVSWTANAEADLAGYQIIRSTDAGATWDAASTSLLGTNSFQDDKYILVQYRVAAVDNAANESGYSNLIQYRAPTHHPKFPTQPVEP